MRTVREVTEREKLDEWKKPMSKKSQRLRDLISEAVTRRREPEFHCGNSARR